jgi:hypothetical protein
MDRDLTGVTAASISAIQPMRPRLSGRPRARHSPSGARRENRRSWRPHEANVGIIDSRSSRWPRRAGHLPQRRERLLRAPGEGARPSLSRGPQATPIKLEAIGFGGTRSSPCGRAGSVPDSDRSWGPDANGIVRSVRDRRRGRLESYGYGQRVSEATRRPPLDCR